MEGVDAAASFAPRILRRLATAAFLVALCGCGESNPAAERAAAEAAKPWLAMMDAGEYARCWEAGASYFQEMESLVTWESKAQEYRGPLGAFQSRTLDTVRYFVDPWGAPPGEYAVVVYDSRWENGDIYESVNMQKQADGQWLVVGYNVQQH